jgi:hypothetical protein
VHLISNDVIECNLIVESCEAGEWLMMPVMTDLVYQVTPAEINYGYAHSHWYR